MLLSEGKTDCLPKEAGYDESRITSLNNHFERLIKNEKILCASYCITRKGKVIAHNGVGKQSYRDDESRTVPANAIQYIASVTKLFTSVAIMKLVEDGYIQLNGSVGAILPQFYTPPFNNITIFQLLTHTSGMHPDPGCFPEEPIISAWGLIEGAYKTHNPKDGDFDWIAATLVNGVRMPPGKEWAYCSFGYVLLGAVIEKITGMRDDQYITENILKPLGMTDTAYVVEPSKKDRWIVQNAEREKKINGEAEEDGEPWISLPRTSGALNSTARDLTIFGNCLLNKGTLNGVRILGRKSVEKMTTLSIHNLPDYTWGSNTPSRRYGIGCDMRNNVDFTYSESTFGHEGAGACSLLIDPEEELVAAWFAPWRDGVDWIPDPLWNVVNVIWSGIE